MANEATRDDLRWLFEAGVKVNPDYKASYAPRDMPSASSFHSFRFLAGWAALVVLAASNRAQADIATDYAAIIGTTAGTISDGYGSPGSIPVHGRASFPVLIDPNNVPALAAGRYGDGVSPTAARAVAAAHTAFFTTSGTNTTSQLFLNAVLWASQKSTPATITVGSTNSTIRTFFSTRGYQTKAITTSMSSGSNDLSGCDVFIGNFHDGFTAAAITKIQTFAANGGGVVVAATPWALSTQGLADAQAVLGPFGLSMSGSTTSVTTFTVAASAYPIYHSALPALDMLNQEKQGQITMTLAEKTIAAGAVDRTLAVRPDEASVNAGLSTLSTSYGTIQVTAAQPLVKANKPVEALLARYQSGRFDAMTAAQLFAHPSASDWPGMPAAGSTVTRTFTIDGNVPADVYMNQGNLGRRIETRLYAAPGATITITIPGALTAAGLTAIIGHQTDVNFNLSQWNRFPKITRTVALTQTTTLTGNVFGGLVWIMVPPGVNLGTFDVTVSGALEAPCFQLGVDTDANWNAVLKTNPGAWGCIMTDNVSAYGNTPGETVYVSRAQLQQVTKPTAVAQHWKNVIETADYYMGYAGFRKRGEAAMTDRDISAGGGHAGYPVVMAYGDSDTLVNGILRSGDWGYYHETGHTFQDDFDSNYTIATNAEVDVNLVPALTLTFLHDQTTWDYTSTYYGSSDRLSKRNAFMALPAAQQLWSTACSTTGSTGAAYDFYYNLSDAFGWELYHTALSRLMRYLQNPTAATDAELFALNTGDTNFKRNRFYLLFCEAGGRNLDTYFQRYGLGVVGNGAEITQAVKDQIAAKGYPVWTDNTPIDSLSTPPALTVAEDAAPGTALYQFAATDADEPGTIWDYQITAGNTGDAFSIDRRTGILRVQKADAETLASYTLTVQVQDNGVPRFSASRTFTVNVTNVAEPPQIDGRLFTATSAMANGTSLGTMTATFEAGRALSSFAIVAGNDGHFAISATTGALTVSNAATLPNPGVIVLTVRAIDSTGAVSYGIATVLCNRTTGVREERWNGSVISGAPAVTSTYSSFTSPQNVGSSYIRRVSGWLVPPKTGIYIFWIASDDDSTLSLSPDETAANRVVIGSVSGFTNFQTWTTQASQKSAPFFLQTGRAYYIEAIQKEGGGGDHVSVAWQGPGIAQQVIPGSALIPADAASACPPPQPAKAIEQWRATRFGVNINNALIAADDADPEGDGLRNVLEYALGTDPSLVTAPPWQPSFEANRLAFNCTRNTEATDLTVTVQATDSPGGSWTDLARSTSGGAFTALQGGVAITETGTGTLRNVAVRDLYDLADPLHPRRFMRLQITGQ